MQVGTECLCLTSCPPSACPQPPGSEELPCSGEGGRENLLHQAMQNSGIVLERVTGEEGALEQAPPAAPSPQPLGDGPPELPLLEVEPAETVGGCAAGKLLWGSDLGYRVTTLAWEPSLLCSLGWKH